MNYQFTVKDAKEVDFRRILTEAPADQDAILLVGAGDKALLLVRQSFLERHDIDDGIQLAGRTLHPTWGYPGAYAANGAGGLLLVQAESNLTIYQNGWKSMQLDKKAIRQTIEELKVARAFRPKRVVRVKYI